MRVFDNSEKCLVMGILNVTPDSFSDDGHFDSPSLALDHTADMCRHGADVIDVGGESTRPGADPVTAGEELDRVIPVIEELQKRFPVPISIDTSKAMVMREAVGAGATIINDVRALREEGALEVAAELRVPVCLMHMLGEPRSMQEAPEYDDVVADVLNFFRERVRACSAAGIDTNDILIDPGFGFGKALAHNLQLMRHLSEIVALGFPVLVGMSRKSMIGQMLDRPVDQRGPAGLALALLARQRGARIIRTHDVGPTVDALRILEMV
jgi:dihydropteroate synthase